MHKRVNPCNRKQDLQHGEVLKSALHYLQQTETGVRLRSVHKYSLQPKSGNLIHPAVGHKEAETLISAGRKLTGISLISTPVSCNPDRRQKTICFEAIGQHGIFLNCEPSFAYCNEWQFPHNPPWFPESEPHEEVPGGKAIIWSSGRAKTRVFACGSKPFY